MKKLIIPLAVILVLCLLLSFTLFGVGLLDFFRADISPDHVAVICVTDGLTTGETFQITDPEAISRITALINNLGPSVGLPSSKNGWHYSVSLKDAAGAEILRLTAVDSHEISSGGYFYRADASALIAYLSDLDAKIS